MAIDPYALCPGGTGKKIKFCCPDLIHELEKVERMLAGDQRAACLEHIEKLEQHHPDRACLLTIKAAIATTLGNVDQAATTLGVFREKYPANPVALAETAVLKATQEGALAAVAPLQEALEACADQLPYQVFQAVGMVAQALFSEGRGVAAHGHLMLRLAMGDGNDRESFALLAMIRSSTSIPLLLRQELRLVPPPEDALWKGTFDQALETAMSGSWRAAAEKFRALAEQAGDWPPIWRNIATLKAWLGEDAAAAEAWRQFAAQKGVPLDDAAEALALAQLLDAAPSTDSLEVVQLPYEIRDMETVSGRLASDKRFFRVPINVPPAALDDEPPPRGIYLLLDRPVLATGSGISREAVPRALGQIFLFGKQTDRQARLELISQRPGELPRAQELLSQIMGESVAPPGEEKVISRVDQTAHILMQRWHLPEDTSSEQRRALQREEARHALLEEWPRLPQQILEGKSAQEVAADPAWRARLMAALLVLEGKYASLLAGFDLDELRQRLGLPRPEQITGTPVAEAPIVRYDRFDVGSLSDEDLQLAFRRASVFRHAAAMRKLLPEVLRRPSLEQKIDRAQAYGSLAQFEPDETKALEYLSEARRASEAAKKSCASWDLVELGLRMIRGEVEESSRLLNHIRQAHMREPGVAEALLQLLVEMGVLQPDGTPTAAAELAVPGAQEAEPRTLWTPDSPTPAGGAKKSAIWTPDG